MNTTGQIWSLDVVLAAVIFTLAIGLVLGQAEWQAFNDQSERARSDLVLQGIFLSNAFVSKPDLILHVSPLAPSDDNLRCGPNAWWDNGSGSWSLESESWILDNDLSWLENCVIERNAPFSATMLGYPSSYSVTLRGQDSGGQPLKLSGGSPGSAPYYSISRRMLVFDDPSIGAVQWRACMDGECASYLTDVEVVTWR